jgi:hypothetical protein
MSQPIHVVILEPSQQTASRNVDAVALLSVARCRSRSTSSLFKQYLLTELPYSISNEIDVSLN